MEHRLLNYKNSQISYCCFGTGSKPVLCFHGYGEEADSYHFLEKYAGTEFRFYSIDLPLHGKTQWKEGLNFTPHDLQQIVEHILHPDNQQPVTSNQQLTLVGFSLGGRMALRLYQSQPNKIEKLILLAPDGLKVNCWYWLATQTWIGNRLFAFTMKHPGWFFGFLKLLNKLKLVNASIFKFVNHYIGDKEVRQLLYERWTTLRKVKPDLEVIKEFARTNNIPVRLIYGQHDRIILSSVGEKFKKGIEGQCDLSIIRSGHQVLHEKHVEEILSALRH